MMKTIKINESPVFTLGIAFLGYGYSLDFKYLALLGSGFLFGLAIAQFVAIFKN